MVRKIAIIGDGLASLAGVYNIARRLPLSEDTQLELDVIGPKAGTEDWGKGPVYSSPGSLNVATEKMGFTSRKEDEVHRWMTPDGFLKWLTDNDGYAALLRGEKGENLQKKAAKYEELQEKFKKGTYLERRLYGLYLESLHNIVREKAVKHGVAVDFVQGIAVDGDVVSEGDKKRFKTILESKREIVSDRVFDATGNGAVLASIACAPDVPAEKVIQNPWRDLLESAKKRKGTFIVLGTGLTFVDKIKELNEAGFFNDPNNKVIAISNHAFMPLAHAREGEKLPMSELDAFVDDLKNLLTKPSITAYELKKTVDKHILQRDADGTVILDENRIPALKKGWQDIINKIRESNTIIWEKFSEGERQTFNDVYGSWWNPLRNRTSPEDHDMLTSLVQSGKLELKSGTIAHVHNDGHENLAVDCELNVYGARPRALRPTTQQVSFEPVIALVNCTGPSRNLEKRSLLHKNLLNKGVVEIGPAGNGLGRAEDGFSAKGSQGVFYDLSGEGSARGEDFEANGWTEGREKNEKQTGYVVENLIKMREAEKNIFKPEQLEAVEKGITDIFARHEGEIDGIFARLAGRSEKFLNAIADRDVDLFHAIRDIKTKESKIRQPHLVAEILERFPDTTLWDRFKALREADRPLLDKIAIDEFTEQRRMVMEIVRVELPELIRKHLHFLAEEFLQPKNPESERGYGKHLVFNNDDAGVFARTFVFEPSQETPVHNHKARCISFMVSGSDVRELVFDNDNPAAPVMIRDEKGNPSIARKKPAKTSTTASPYKDAGDRFDWHMVLNNGDDRAVLFHVYDGIAIRPDGKIKFETRRESPDIVETVGNMDLRAKPFLSKNDGHSTLAVYAPDNLEASAKLSEAARQGKEK